MHYRTLIIDNISDNYRRDDTNSSKERRYYWRKFDAHYGNRSIFYEGDDKAIITTELINSKYLDDTIKLFGWENILNISPIVKSLSISNDIINDTYLNSVVIGIIKNCPGINIIPLRHSMEFYSLLSYLKRKKLRFNVPEVLPFEKEFFRNYYDTKGGFRALSGEIQNKENLNVSIPEGYVVTNIKDILSASNYFYKRKKYFVIKSNSGTQGDKMVVFNNHDSFLTEEAFSKHLKKSLQALDWQEFNVVVEEYIDSNKDIYYSPSVEFNIHPDGSINFLYAGYQIFKEDTHSFMGLYIDPKILKDISILRAKKYAYEYGKVLYSKGYRGYYDIDLITTKKGTTYAVESNLRRTGGTYIHFVLNEIFGPHYYKSVYALGFELQEKSVKGCNYESLVHYLSSYIFNKSCSRGIIFANPDLIDIGMVNIIIVENSKKALFNMYEEIKHRLGNYSKKGQANVRVFK
jgi:hypothetical protein